MTFHAAAVDKPKIADLASYRELDGEQSFLPVLAIYSRLLDLSKHVDTNH